MNNVKKIQRWLELNNFDFFLVPHNDEFQSEYTAKYAKRLNWITSFSGSYGIAIISKKKSILFVDGRYTIQARKEVNNKFFYIKNISNFSKWIKNNFCKNKTVCIDPTLHTKHNLKLILSLYKKKNIDLKFLNKNPIDQYWKNKPHRPYSNSFLHKLIYSGQTSVEKINKIIKFLKRNRCNFYILLNLESISWLLNLKGNDFKFTPLNISYLIINISRQKKVSLFISKKKIKNTESKLKEVCNIYDLDYVSNYLKRIKKNSIIGIDKNATSIYFENLLKENNLKIKYLEDPCLIPKSIKNKTEIRGAKKANLRDSVSMTKFIYWIKNKMIIKNTTELVAAKKALFYRKSNKNFFSLSFETISALGKNSAMPHYIPNQKNNKKFINNSIYLIDSGTQYFDGTTDMTRTIIIGKASIEQKSKFTRVLKGHISVATRVFSKKSKGNDLDNLARKSLLEINENYNHSTGHGVGSFSSVHELPFRISKIKNKHYFNSGIILSNEPAYYKKMKYGIRIENLLLIKDFNYKSYCFDILTYVPIDKDLIMIELLNQEEISWINNYHKKVYDLVHIYLNNEQNKWLFKVTSPLKI